MRRQGCFHGFFKVPNLVLKTAPFLFFISSHTTALELLIHHIYFSNPPAHGFPTYSKEERFISTAAYSKL